MIRTNLPANVVLARYMLQLRDWEVAKLDAMIAYDVHTDLGANQDFLDKITNRIIEAEKAIRLLQKHCQELETIKEPYHNGVTTEDNRISS